VVELRQTSEFAGWLDALRDIRARARVQARIERLAMGNPGDIKFIGEGVCELRVARAPPPASGQRNAGRWLAGVGYGPGYRVYFIQRGHEVVILLAGGDKSSQTKDIRTALRLARGL
jgi:putative component of toxin-antitoxin plasmid stabilization module